MSKYAYFDILTHFLPGMDLGCKNAGDSIKMITTMIDQGCQGAIVTPHFYPHETIEEYIERRTDSLMQFHRNIVQTELVDFETRIAIGTEVTYHHSLVFNNNLFELCLGDSNYLLLEMPFSKWKQEYIDDIERLMRFRGVKVIISHLERFFEYGNKKYIDQLLDMDVLIQMNTMHLLKFGAFRHALKMIKEMRVDLLATDCHGIFFYPPNMEKAVEKMKKENLEDELDRMMRNNLEIYKAAMAD